MLTVVGIVGLALGLVLAPVLERRRRQASRQRTAAELRVALLETARSLPGHDLADATRLACEGLRTLGFDAAAVSVRRGRVMTPLYSVGLPALPRPIPAEGSFAARCLDENRTLVVDDYASLPTRRADRADLRTVVLTPVRADGRPVATLNAARLHVAEPTQQEITIAETVATHLGRVFATQAAVSAQDQRLERMQRLEAMRTGFVEDVTDELHARLQALRECAEHLLRDDLADAVRRTVLTDLVANSDDLRATIDVLLDFSRFQAHRAEAALEPIEVGELLAPVQPVEGSHAADVFVDVDAGIVRHALELLRAGRPADEEAQLHEEPDHVRLVLPAPGDAGRSHRDDLLAALAERLLLTAGASLVDPDEIVLPRWRVT